MIPVDCLSQKAKDDDDDEMMVMLVVMTLTEGALGREDDTETEVAKVTMVMVMDGDNGDGDGIDRGGALPQTRSAPQQPQAQNTLSVACAVSGLDVEGHANGGRAPLRWGVVAGGGMGSSVFMMEGGLGASPARAMPSL